MIGSKNFQAILLRARRRRPPFAAAVEDAWGAEDTLLAFFLPELLSALLPVLAGAPVAEAAGAFGNAAFPVAVGAGVEAAPLTGGAPFTTAVAEALADALSEAVAEVAADAAGGACAAGGEFFLPPPAPAKGLPSAVTVN